MDIPLCGLILISLYFLTACMVTIERPALSAGSIDCFLGGSVASDFLCFAWRGDRLSAVGGRMEALKSSMQEPLCSRRHVVQPSLCVITVSTTSGC